MARSIRRTPKSRPASPQPPVTAYSRSKEAHMAISDVATFAHLSEAAVEALGREFDAIRRDIEESRGADDAAYISRIISIQRRLMVAARLTLFASSFPPAWVAGTAMLAAGKILENMEIGHNVMHGQWDWMNDPEINSSTWDWDAASTAEAWKHSHNYVHHTYTNIRGKDRDLGYEIMRIDPHQKWNPVYLAQPFYNLLLAAIFEWGVAFHDLDFEAIRRGEKSKEAIKRELKGMAGKARAQIVKDYVAFPLISAGLAAGATWAAANVRGKTQSRVGRGLRALGLGAAPSTKRAETIADALDAARRTFRTTAQADVAANVVRNVWAYAIIFCGHFPDQTYTFSPEEVADETRGG